MPQAIRMFPPRTPEMQSFWEGYRHRQLLVPRCRVCGAFHAYPRALCPRCSSSGIEWVASSGKGHLYSYIISHSPPSGPTETRSVIAVIELEEGVLLMATLKGIEPDPDVLSIGMSLEVVFEEESGEVTLLTFRPVSP